MPHSPGWRASSIEQLRGLAHLRRGGEVQVGPMEARDEHLGRIHAQRLQDVGTRARIGGRGQRHARHAGEAVRQTRQLAIFGAELVAPLRHAMRLVDREQRQRQARQPLHRAVAQQPLGRDIQQIELLLDQVARDAARLGGIQVGVQRAGRDAKLPQRRHLVVHQRDQRRDHDGGAGTTQRGDLEADALAAAGRHQDQGVAACDDVVDRLFLLAAKPGKSEHATQHRRRRLRKQRLQHGSVPADADLHPAALLR